jgi:hypothetical protein
VNDPVTDFQVRHFGFPPKRASNTSKDDRRHSSGANALATVGPWLRPPGTPATTARLDLTRRSGVRKRRNSAPPHAECRPPIQRDVSGVLAACSRLEVHDRAERFRTNGGGALDPGRSAAPLGAARLVHFLTQSKHGRGGSHDEQAWPARPEDALGAGAVFVLATTTVLFGRGAATQIAHASSRVESMRLRDKLADAQFTRGCGRPTNSWPHSSQESFR